MTPEPGLQGVQAILAQDFQALAAVVEHGRGRESHVQVIQRMTPQVAIPGVPGGPCGSVGIARLVTLCPERLSMAERQLSALVCGAQMHGLLCFCLCDPTRAFKAHDEGGRRRIVYCRAFITIFEQTRAQASLEYGVDRCKASSKIGEFPGLEQTCLRQGKQTQRGAGDDAEAAFGTNKQAVQARASGRFFDRTRGDHLAGREHGFYSQHLVPHGAIFSPQITKAIGTNGPANSGDSDGPRIMAARQPVECRSLVQRLDSDPSTHISHTVGWSDVDLLEPAQVEHQSWYKRCRSTHQPTATA